MWLVLGLLLSVHIVAFSVAKSSNRLLNEAIEQNSDAFPLSAWWIALLTKLLYQKSGGKILE